MQRMITLAGASLELVERGAGRPLLFLHPGEGLQPERPWLDLLARRFRVIAPHHPGLGNSPLPDWLRHGRRSRLSVSRSRGRSWACEDAVLVGACFGGWIAAEMAVRDTRRFAGLVLVGAARDQGRRRAGPRHRRHARASPAPSSCASPGPIRARGEIDLRALPETELAAIARGREAFALFGWKPYMHNPRLKRWLHRIDRADAAAVGRRRTASSRRPTARPGSARNPRRHA